MRSLSRTWHLIGAVALLSLVFVTACQQTAAPSPTVASKPAATSAPAGVPAATSAPAATAAPAAQAAPKPSTYKIGNMGALTGSQGEIGTSFKNIFDVAVNQINDKGGVDGVKLQSMHEDHMADPKQGIVAFTKLASVDKVPVIMSSWSSVIVGMSPAAEENKTVLINYGANAPSIRGSGKYTFSTLPLADTDVVALAKYIYTEKNARKLAVIHINNESGRVPAGKMREAFEKLGGQIVAFETHDPDAMDFGAQLAKIKAANPDVVHIHSLVWESARIVKQMRELGMKQQITSYTAVETPQMQDIAADAADGLIYTSYVPPEIPAMKSLMDAYNAKYPRFATAAQYAYYIADTVQLVADAIKVLNQKGLAYNGENFRQVLIDTKQFNTPLTGKTVFQIPGQDVLKPVTLKTIRSQGGKFTFEVVKTLEQ